MSRISTMPALTTARDTNVSSSTHSPDRAGVQRRMYMGMGDVPTYFVDTKKPRIGGRNWFINRGGVYVLAQGEGSLRSFACTLANVGFIEISDLLITSNGETSWVAETQEKPIVQMAPPILGQFPLDANFQNGLVVKVSGGQHAPLLTVVWFLLNDMLNK